MRSGFGMSGLRSRIWGLAYTSTYLVKVAGALVSTVIGSKNKQMGCT